MNKYLKKCNELTKDLALEFKESGYAVVSKLQIAIEVENFLENYDEFKGLKLTQEQEEKLIDIICEFYLNLEIEEGVFKPTKAIMFTILEYKSILDFFKEVETNYDIVCSQIIWRM